MYVSKYYQTVFVSLVLDGCNFLVLIISTVDLVAVVAETPPAMDFLEILFAVSYQMVLQPV